MSRFLDMIRRANRPGPPEHSVSLRVAAAATVMVGIAACHSQGELSSTETATTVLLVGFGMVFSYLTRRRPRLWVKPTLALAVVVAFAWFFHRIVSGTIGDISQVEEPLAALFAWIQVTHAFDVPARRDLSFSLAGSASLMAVAGAQAVDLSFGLYVVVWLAFGLWGMFGMWSSASGGGRVGTVGAAVATVAVAVIAVGAIAVLPAPHVSGNVSFPSSATGDSPLSGLGGSIDGDGGSPSEPARAGTPAGASRVGGYLGFANRLDTALRPNLGDQVVMRVRAQRPTYWVGETFDRWDGQSWLSPDRHLETVGDGSPFAIPPPSDSAMGGASDLQTFYLAQYGPNLVFHAPDASEVWFPSSHLYVGSDGTILAPLTMGPGTVYTVESSVTQATPAELQTSDRAAAQLQPSALRADTQLPTMDPRVAALAREVTAHASTTYDKVEALIGWIGTHTRYSTDIPPLQPGQDAVTEFLFGNRVGFCEQISTALAVMLRTLGVPSREAVGYVPGSYDPITDLYEVQAKDAHAWVQVWFPGYGWQNFDPTADVPLANPTPGGTLVHDVGAVVGRVPAAPTGVALAVVAALVAVWRWRRRRPASWEEAMARRIERAGARAGRPRQPGETLERYAAALDELAGDHSGTLRAVASTVEASAYGGDNLPVEARRQAARVAATWRVSSKRRSATAPSASTPPSSPVPAAVGPPGSGRDTDGASRP